MNSKSLIVTAVLTFGIFTSCQEEHDEIQGQLIQPGESLQFGVTSILLTKKNDSSVIF